MKIKGTYTIIDKQDFITFLKFLNKTLKKEEIKEVAEMAESPKKYPCIALHIEGQNLEDDGFFGGVYESYQIVYPKRFRRD